MPIQILMPALSPTMEEGKLAKWLVKEGDQVRAGAVIAEIETDKATMEVEAVDEGVVHRILVPAGTDKVKVNQPIAIILAEGERAPASTASAAPTRESAPPKAAGPSPRAGPPGAGDLNAGTSSAVTVSTARLGTGMVGAGPLGGSGVGEAGGAGAGARSSVSPVATPTLAPRTTEPASRESQRQFISPLARRLARENAIDLSRVRGTGPQGRVVKRDIEAAIAAGATGTATRPSPVPPGPGTAITAPMPIPAPAVAPEPMADAKILALYEKGSYEVVPHDGMRRVIAERLTQSKQTIPHFYMSVDCRLDELLRARERINAASPKEGPKAFKLSVNDFCIKALALALQRVPAANATWTEAGMLRHRHSDVGVAVAVEGGLFTPVIRHAELKTLAEISNEMKDLADRARRRRLAPQEYQGGTTSISNLGMYGIASFDAVINPPHATILAVGAGERRPVVGRGDTIEIATLMRCTLSCDHRVVDGAVGAELLNAFKQFIEDPVRMLV